MTKWPSFSGRQLSGRSVPAGVAACVMNEIYYMDDGAAVQKCWACGIELRVPLIHKEPAKEFKVGWCNREW